MCEVLTWKSLDRWLGEYRYLRKKEPQVQVNDDNAVSKGHSVVLLTFRLKSYGSNTTNQMQSEKEICPKKGISIALYSRLTPDIFFQCSNLRKWSRNMTAIDRNDGLPFSPVLDNKTQIPGTSKKHSDDIPTKYGDDEAASTSTVFSVLISSLPSPAPMLAVNASQITRLAERQRSRENLH